MTADPPAAPKAQPSPFRLVEKRYKARAHPTALPAAAARRIRRQGSAAIFRPSLIDVWDPRSLLSSGEEGASTLERSNGPWDDARRQETVECFDVGRRGRKAWAVKDVPGLVVLPAYLSPDEQRSLVTSCLSDYTQPPNRTNLDQHYILPSPPSTLWSLYVDSTKSGSAEAIIQPRHASLTAEQVARYTRMPTGRELVNNTPGEQLTADEVRRSNEHLPAPSPTAKPTKVGKLLKELRWTNLGLFYDWSSKNYAFNNRIPFPSDLGARLESVVRDDVDWARVYTGLDEGVREKVGWEKWAEDYELDAGIINFYQTNDSLMAHVDRSELDPYRPLVSVSLGLSAVFLLGGETRDDPPLPILLRSGDALVISGPSRRAYHGIPRVLDGTLPAHLADAARDPVLASYLQTTRININSRQVFPPSVDSAGVPVHPALATAAANVDS